MDEAERIDPGTVAAWRAWLAQHHGRETGVWVRVPRRTAPLEGEADELDYVASVMEALCWGWIDGTTTKAESGGQWYWYSPRRRGSPWAASNRARIEELEAAGRMQPPGRALVDAARADGSWTLLMGPERGEEPTELTAGLDADPVARAFWDELPPSARLYALTQIALAKRDETRLRRIAQLVERCAAQQRPDR